MRLTMLGTGKAEVTECYNTCFVLQNEKGYFLVDGGGGVGLLRQLRRAGIGWKELRTIFVTHRHLDHLLGIFWMIRLITRHMSLGEYEGDVMVYCHDEVTGLLRDLTPRLFPQKEARFLDDRIRLVTLEDGDEHEVLGRPVHFFDLRSTKAKQFGFCMEYEDGKRLCCLGDEPYKPWEEPWAKGADWLMHEAFCLYEDRDVFTPYRYHHSTARDAAQTAEQLGAKNLILYHTEDTDIPHRKERYGEEGREAFHGSLYVPDDLESFEL